MFHKGGMAMVLRYVVSQNSAKTTGSIHSMALWRSSRRQQPGRHQGGMTGDRPRPGDGRDVGGGHDRPPARTALYPRSSGESPMARSFAAASSPRATRSAGVP